MKNILVPTDFSINAHAAALYGAVLARQTNARLVLLHVLGEQECSSEELDLEDHSQKMLDALAAELHSLYRVSITRLLRPGTVNEEILTLASILKADLIIVGVQGSSQLVGNPLGATAAQLLLATEPGVICVPDHGLLSFPELTDELALKHYPYINARGSQLLQELVQANNGVTAKTVIV